MLAYAQDYDETFTSIGYNGDLWYDANLGSFNSDKYDNPTAGRNYHGWAAVILPYIKNTQVYRCPSTDYHCYGVAYGLPAQGMTKSGSKVSLFDANLKLGVFAQPSQTMMISEKGEGGGNQYILSDVHYACRASHNDGGNITFVDGHSKWMKFERGPIGHGWPDNAATPVHPPYQTFFDIW